MEWPEALVKNLDILRADIKFAETVYLIEKALEEEAPFWQEEPSDSEYGEPTAFVEDENGERYYFEAVSNPRQIAFRRTESLESGSNIVVMGAGLGYTLEALNEIVRKGDIELKHIIIIERHATMMARALAQADLEHLINRKGTEIVLGYTPISFKIELDPDTTLMVKNHVLFQLDEEYYTVAFSNLKYSEFRILPLTKKDRYNILVICEDSLRRDRLGLYGADSSFSPTPYFDEFFKDAFIMDAVTISTWTPTVVASMFSGAMPWEHGIVTEILSKKGDKRMTRINKIFRSPCANLARLERFKVMISANAWIHPKFGFWHGFNVYLTTLADQGWKGHGINKQVGKFINPMKDSNFFLYVHYMDTHQPFNFVKDRTIDLGRIRANFPTDPRLDPLYKRDLAQEIQAYNSSVSTCDLYTGNLIDMIKEEKLSENTIVALFGDHGEELRERNTLNWPRHGHALYGELTKVPLMIKVPEELKQKFRDELEPFKDKQFHLMNLIPLLNNVADGGKFDPSWFDDTIVSFTGFHCMKVALTQNGCKYIRDIDTGKEEFYDLSNDPGERKNLAGIEDELYRYRTELNKILPPDYEIPDEKEMETSYDDEEMQEIQAHLEELGYI